MTVHKSQGSEFGHCVLILPDQHNPILTRELVYTGITRAKHRFTLVASQDTVVRKAISQMIERGSGL
jgi:exodeoxyribonuclease V alpha subunit